MEVNTFVMGRDSLPALPSLVTRMNDKANGNTFEIWVAINGSALYLERVEGEDRKHKMTYVIKCEDLVRAWLADVERVEATDETLWGAATEAFKAVNDAWKAVPVADQGACETHLYVYPNGVWVLDHPQYLQDHNTLAQAPIGAYEKIRDLVAALGETVADDVPCTVGHK